MIFAHLSETLIFKAQGTFNESDTTEGAMRASFCVYRGFAIVQSTRDDIYTMQSQLRDRLSEVRNEPLNFEFEIEESNDEAITVNTKSLVGFDLTSIFFWVLL